MGYIIVWRPNSQDPHIDLNSRFFKEEYSSFEQARDAAEEMIDNDHYRNYAIFEEVTS